MNTLKSSLVIQLILKFLAASSVLPVMSCIVCPAIFIINIISSLKANSSQERVYTSELYTSEYMRKNF